MDQIVEVLLGDFRPVSCFDQNHVECQRGDLIIVEVERGTEFGKVVGLTDQVPEQDKKGRKNETISGKAVRKVTEGDLNQIKNNRIKVKDALNSCLRKINEQHLDMQLVNAEYTFDCSKIIFFFTAEGRVDFRGLVKDLAKIFRVRIELKQIGVRDRAKMVVGYGVCGRQLCCSSYMRWFHPLSIKMAKEQALPLNPSRISGVCGRIKCCMAYEFVVYRDLVRSLPHIGEKVNTPEGKGKVKDINILKRTVFVDLGEGKVTKLVYSNDHE